MRYRLTNEADQNLEQILIEGVFQFGDVQALKYQDSFKHTFELLAYLPKLGRKSERGIRNEHRFPHGAHIIYYLIEADEIIITTLIKGSTIKDIWGE